MNIVATSDAAIQLFSAVDAEKGGHVEQVTITKDRLGNLDIEAKIFEEYVDTMPSNEKPKRTDVPKRWVDKPEQWWKHVLACRECIQCFKVPEEYLT